MGRNYQNSSKLTDPDLLVSNIRIIMRTVWGSKGVQSPFTSAVRSSASVSSPLPVKLSASSKSHNHDSRKHTVLIHSAKQSPQCFPVIRIPRRRRRRRRPALLCQLWSTMISLRRRSMAIVRWWWRSNGQSGIRPRIVPAVVPRVVVCAWWGSAVISTTSCAPSSATAVALVWAMIVSLGGSLGRRFVVVRARGAGTRRT
jgi:hypothetical protein